MELNVKWGNKSFTGDAKKVYLEIESIGENVKPQEMVDYAKSNPMSELHKCFTWDNDKAADKYRLYEARQIACNLVVNWEKADTPDVIAKEVRILHRASTDINEGYKPLPVIIKNDNLYSGLLDEAVAKLNEFKRKYAILTELKPIFALIDKL